MSGETPYTESEHLAREEIRKRVFTAARDLDFTDEDANALAEECLADPMKARRILGVSPW